MSVVVRTPMINDSTRQQSATEAKQLFANAQSMTKKGVGLEVENYHIESHSRKAYRPAAFVEQTGTIQLYRELCDLLEQLWRINEEHVGELITEVNVYFSLSNMHAELADRFMDWCHQYLELRLNRENPKDQGSPFLTYLRLFQEYKDAVGVRLESVDFLVADKSLCFARWFLFEQTWSDSIQVAQEGYELNIGIADPLIQENGPKDIMQYGLGRNDLVEFLRSVAESDGRKQIAKFERLGIDELLDRIALATDGLQEMRLLLARNFRPEKTVMMLAQNLAVACKWVATSGVIKIIVGPSKQLLLENIPTLRTTANVLIRHDGLLIDGNRPWETTRDINSDSLLENLAINAYIVELIHNKLFEFYDQIDFDKIRQRTEQVEAESLDDELLAVTYLDLCRDEETPAISVPQPSVSKYRIRSLHMKKFLQILKRLGCEIRSGKGDETTVYREGGKKYCLGHRKDVHRYLVKNVLKRLGISIQEWCSAIDH